MVLAVYGELADDRLHQLQQHLQRCTACSAELEQWLAIKTLATALPVEEPDANLVARSRIRLEEALDRLPPKRWYDRAAEWLTRSAAGMAAAPLAASVLLLTGIGAGTLVGYQVAQRRAANVVMQQASLEPAVSATTVNEHPDQVQPSVTNVAQIAEVPHTGLIDIRYSTLEQRHIQGSLDNPEVRDLLMFASQEAPNPSVRDHSIALLAAACSNGKECAGPETAGGSLRDALMIALRYDGSAQVRQKALEGLQPYVSEDVQVRDALLEALMNDPDAQIRAHAIAMLTPVDADTSVRQVLSTVAEQDQDSHVRNASRLMLERVSEIQ
jgi:hypothetical protein